MKNGFHAVAVDEERVDFTPTLWDDRDGVVQVLFPGAHADVGGGYPAGEAFAARWRENMTRGDSKQASSMYRDLQQGNDVEVDPILGDLLDRAQKAGVATPLLAAAYTHLKVYQRRLSRREN